ncbi:MAG: hypothetical protein RQ745_02985 [Longimicrobiales bacterium]|nr:hypothetical protein [Longimicrobiales bacterium]
MKCLAITLLAGSPFVLIPDTLVGQRSETRMEAVGPCGPLADDFRQLLLEHYTPLFTEVEGSDALFQDELGLEFVGPEEPMHVVASPADCGPVVAEAFRLINAELSFPATRANMEWVVYRIGPYYVVSITPLSGGAVKVDQWSDVLVFLIDDLELVTKLLG